MEASMNGDGRSIKSVKDLLSSAELHIAQHDSERQTLINELQRALEVERESHASSRKEIGQLKVRVCHSRPPDFD